jgi:hypothetical protein
MYELIAVTKSGNRISLILHSDVILLKQLGETMLFKILAYDKNGDPVVQFDINECPENGKVIPRFTLWSTIHMWIDIED